MGPGKKFGEKNMDVLMKSLLLGLLMILAIPLSLHGQSASGPGEPNHVLSIVFSSNLHGEVEPCG
jgi:hypothetical protein